MRKGNHVLQYDLFAPPDPLLDIVEAGIRRDKGIVQAEQSANTKVPDWVERAYNLFKVWLKQKPEGFLFMIEDCRGDIAIDVPPSKTAWGGIPKKAKKDGLIEFAWYQQVKNVLCHSTPASVWKKL